MPSASPDLRVSVPAWLECYARVLHDGIRAGRVEPDEARCEMRALLKRHLTVTVRTVDGTFTIDRHDGGAKRKEPRPPHR